jgi:hypothetical protein
VAPLTALHAAAKFGLSWYISLAVAVVVFVVAIVLVICPLVLLDNIKGDLRERMNALCETERMCLLLLAFVMSALLAFLLLRQFSLARFSATLLTAVAFYSPVGTAIVIAYSLLKSYYLGE